MNKVILIDTHRRRSPFCATRAVVTIALASGFMLSGCAQLPALLELPNAQTTEIDAQADQAADAATAAADDAVDAAPDPIPEPQETPRPGQLYDWSGDGQTITRIVIDTNEQKARFYAGEDQVGWTTVATGLPTHATPRGEFVIIEKVADKRSNLYGKIVNASGAVIKSSADSRDPIPRGGRFVGANMPNFMRMTYDGIGMHAGPIPNPGRPASHGCIRMPKQMASAVFRHVSPGTPVTVIGNGPDYGNYAARIREQQREEAARRAAAEAAKEGSPLDALDAEIDSLGQTENATAGDEAAAAGASAGAQAPQAAMRAGDADTDSAAAAAAAAESTPEPTEDRETSPEANASGLGEDIESIAPQEDAAPEQGGDSDTPDYYRAPAPPPQIRAAGEPAPAGQWSS
jgi:lipoprotein-anchoring transpeptidase ErfK/SrfK